MQEVDRGCLHGALLVAARCRRSCCASDEERPVERDYMSLVKRRRHRRTADGRGHGRGQVGTAASAATPRPDAPTMHVTHRRPCSAAPIATAAMPRIRCVAQAGRSDYKMIPAYVAARRWSGACAAALSGELALSRHRPIPSRSYTLLNKEAPEYIRFINPGDYRVARESCGCLPYAEVIEAAERSMMASGAMLWGGAAYNNGIAALQELHPRRGLYARGRQRRRSSRRAIRARAPSTPIRRRRAARWRRSIRCRRWQVIPPATSSACSSAAAAISTRSSPRVGLPNPPAASSASKSRAGPTSSKANRGPGTGLRVAIPVLNIHKTRLNDPFMWFMGTNDQPGDYRGSGCTGCHVIYANDREPRHSLTYAQFGRDGQTGRPTTTDRSRITSDPTIRVRRRERRPFRRARRSMEKRPPAACSRARSPPRSA